MIPELRMFQCNVIDRVRNRIAEGKRIIILQSPTGSGKTITASAIVKRAAEKGSTVLFMVHRRRLVDQIASTLEQFQVNHGIIMRGEVCNPGALVQVASRDTLLSRCVRHDWKEVPEAKLVIVDEAHHAADPSSEYRRILTEHYPQAIIILLTATPVGPGGQGMGPWAEAMECAAPTTELVREGYLVPVRCYAPERKRKGRKFLRGICGDLVSSWQQYAEGRPTALFCSRVAHSLDAVKAFEDAGIPAAHVDADTDDSVRDRIFDQIADGRIKVLSNVGIIGEGVDIPELGCCQIFCECGSRVGFLQRCGRIMRPSGEKKYGILIDHSGACFRHGFPDEDTEWTLDGNTNEKFAAKHDKGETEQALYCRHCEIVYHGDNGCPQCGRLPSKPPKSIFAPPPVESTNEILVEADRNGDRSVYDKEEKISHWFRCLQVAIKRNGNFLQASAIFKQKYGHFPDSDYPCLPGWHERREKVSSVYPDGFKKVKA